MVGEIIRMRTVAAPSTADLRRGIVLRSAAELMFFFDAPLAHVVAYEDWQRELRRRHTFRRQRRGAIPLPAEIGA